MRDLNTSEKRERMTGTSEERFPSLLSHPLSLIFNSNIPPNAIAGEVRMAGYRPRSILPAQVANQNLGFSLYCPLAVLENSYDRSHYLVVNIYRNSAEKCRVISIIIITIIIIIIIIYRIAKKQTGKQSLKNLNKIIGEGGIVSHPRV